MAVAAANCVNIPLMRQGELINGIALMDENGNYVTDSKLAAAKGISQVVFSRIFMAFPGMSKLREFFFFFTRNRCFFKIYICFFLFSQAVIPIIMEKIQSKPLFCKYPNIQGPVQVLAAGLS